MTQVIYQFGMVVWSTPKMIRVIHYKRGEQKICKINIPRECQNIPQDMYLSNLAMPKITMRLDTENRSVIPDPNVQMFIAWFNEVKKVNLYYTKTFDKFDAKTMTEDTRVLGDCYLVGINVSMINSKYVTVAFDHTP